MFNKIKELKIKRIASYIALGYAIASMLTVFFLMTIIPSTDNEHAYTYVFESQAWMLPFFIATSVLTYTLYLVLREITANMVKRYSSRAQMDGHMAHERHVIIAKECDMQTMNEAMETNAILEFKKNEKVVLESELNNLKTNQALTPQLVKQSEVNYEPQT